MRAFEWSTTPLGPIDAWPGSLKTTVGTLLHSHHPMVLWWGRELIQIYNDGYLPSFGKGKHPTAMGQRAEDCWQEIWPIISPQIDDVMGLAKASWHEDALVPVWRNERIEEAYWTYGYSPVFDDSGAVGGTLAVCTETTARVLAERRLLTLRLLAESTSTATTSTEALVAAAKVLATSTADIPFALFYGAGDGGEPTLVRTIGLGATETATFDAVCAPQLQSASVTSSSFDLPSEIPGLRWPGGAWPEPAAAAFAVSLVDERQSYPRAFIVFGLSPRLAFDAAYRGHLTQIAESLGLALARIESTHQRAATALERNNLLLQAPVATALFRGPEHVFELANPLYCRMVGRSNLIGKSYREAFPELVTTELPGVLDRVYRTGEPFSSGELLVPLDTTGSGVLQEFYFTFNLEALRDRSGQVYGMMAVALDITDQVRARRALEESQADREAILTKLQAANRAKDEFLAMLGHELRNPLAPIVTALHLMKRHGVTNREQEIIERQVRHLVRLVDDLLDVSRITRGKITLRNEPVELSVVIANAIEMASDLFEDRRHELSIDVPSEGLRLEGDAVRLAQVAANLLTNAARYTEPGGKISVRARREGDEVRIVVADNGIGIAPDLLPRVFDMFIQGHQSTDRKEGGLGLGLALVKSLVTMQGGVVAARSQGPGKGSEFEIRLPATTKPVAVATAPSSSASTTAPAKSKRILVVDDNVDSAEMMSLMLESAGYQVAIAHDGPEALTIAETFSPEIALLDIGLPVMDGYELGQRLHALADLQACRLVALTGYGQEHDRAQSKASGFEAHLVKPVDMRALLQLIASGASV